jgi:hypothetical protein
MITIRDIDTLTAQLARIRAQTNRGSEEQTNNTAVPAN